MMTVVATSPIARRRSKSATSAKTGRNCGRNAARPSSAPDQTGGARSDAATASKTNGVVCPSVSAMSEGGARIAKGRRRMRCRGSASGPRRNAAAASASAPSAAQIAYAATSGSAPSGTMRSASAGGFGLLRRIVRSGRVACSIARSASASVTDEAAPVATSLADA